MRTTRRQFVAMAAGAAGAAATTGHAARGQATPPRGAEGPSQGPVAADAAIRALAPITGDVRPITDQERLARIDKARRLMAEHAIDAVIMEPGSSMFYFTGVRWGLSERPFALVIPRRGDLAYVTPGFEETRAREITKFTGDIRHWEEDESPYAVIAGILADRGCLIGRIGLEERVRFFVADGVRRAAPAATWVLADPVTAGCRMQKSAGEIALMQKANDVTIRAFQAALTMLREGMTESDLRRHIEAAHRALGAASGSALVLFGQWTALPHGTVNPQRLKEGDVVLIDGGCQIEGYSSDITRTTVLGTPTPRQTDVWNLELEAQNAAFAAARLGVPCEAVTPPHAR